MIKYNLFETCDLENLNPFILIFNICIISSDMNKYKSQKSNKYSRLQLSSLNLQEIVKLR